MAQSNDSRSGKQQELLRTFAEHLPERVATISENWGVLQSGRSWSVTAFMKLYRLVQDLGGTAGNFGLLGLSEQLFSLEVYLSSFVDGDMVPNERQRREIEHLLREIKNSAADPFQSMLVDPGTAPTGPPPAEAGAPGDAPAKSEKPDRHLQTPRSEQPTVFWLKGSGEGNRALKRSLSVYKLALKEFENTPSALEEMSARPPVALIVGRTFVSEIQNIADMIRPIRDQRDCPLPLISDSNSDDLLGKLHALRAGADAAFDLTLEPDILAAYIQEAVDPKATKPFRILIIEDDPSQAEYAATVLSRAGMATATVTDPLQTMSALRRFQPDLILMDIYMPDASGVELTSIIRDHRQFAYTPIVFLSAEQDVNKKLDAMTTGGNDFLTKPVRPHELIAAVSSRVRHDRAMRDRIQNLSERDPVTGLYSRRHFIDRLRESLRNASESQAPVGLLYIELDDGDRLLDEAGIFGFDTVLASVATIVAEQAQKAYMAARFGDHSFTVLVQGTGERDLSQLADNIRSAVSGHILELEGLSLATTCSVGVARVDTTVVDAAKALISAHKACRVAKEAGGDTVKVYEYKNPRQRIGKDEKLVDLVRTALRDRSFGVVYQPIAALKEGVTLRRYQALLRLRTDSGDMLPAATFIPLAEKADLIVDIDRWVAECALKVLRSHQSIERPLRLFISQSTVTLADPEQKTWLQEHFSAQPLHSNSIALEFNAPDVAANLKPARDGFALLRKLGALVSLANFGNDPQSFQLLRHLPIDYVKLAPHYLKLDITVVKEMIDQVHGENTKVIVPLVENAQRIAQIWSTGADYIQGNFIQRPEESLDFDFTGSVI